MRRSRILFTGALAAVSLCLALLAPGCTGLSKALSDLTTTTDACPLPLVWAKGHFYETGGSRKAVFLLYASHEGAMSTDMKRRLAQVEIFGGPKPLMPNQLMADPDKYRLTAFVPYGPWWVLDDLMTTNPHNAWKDGQDYTLVIRHHYRPLKKPGGGWGVGPCDAFQHLTFKGKVKDGLRSKFVPATDLMAEGGPSTGASMSLGGSFFGQDGFALYEGEVIYDNQVGSTKQAEKVEMFSGQSPDPNVLTAGVPFKTKQVPPALPANKWTFLSIRDLTYDDDQIDTWYVVAKVTYTDATGGGTSVSPVKMFTGLATQQGQSVPGE